MISYTMLKLPELSLRASNCARSSIAWSFLVLLVMFSSITFSTTESTVTDSLYRHCGGYIQLSHVPTRSIQLSFSFEDSYWSNSECEVTVGVHNPMRIMLTFLFINVTEGTQCLDKYLQIYDGHQEDRDMKDILVSKQFCTTQATDAFTSQSNNITLRSVRDAVKMVGGFTILITAFHEGECNDLEFRCGNNRCIHSDLCNDDNDNCGDCSDVCQVSVAAVVCVVLMTVLLSAVLFVLLAFLWGRCRRQKCKEHHKHVTLTHQHIKKPTHLSDHIWTISDGAMVVSRLLSQLMIGLNPAVSWISKSSNVK